MIEDSIHPLRATLHRAMIEKLIELYSNKKWKYTFIKNAKEKFSYSIQYHQLNEFEKGKPRNENVINVMLLEILDLQKSFSLEIDAEKKIVMK